MKRFFAMMAVAGIAGAAFFACGGGAKEEDKSEDTGYDDYEIADHGQKQADKTAKAASAFSDQEVKEGLALIEASDCKTCHKANDKIIGPSYAEVAAKYEPTAENVSTLAQKVIHGGSGNWGQIAMTPHPNTTPEDAEKMIKYIMSVGSAK